MGIQDVFKKAIGDASQKRAKWHQTLPDTIIPLEINTSNSFAFGAGIDYKKFSMELRYYINKDILCSYLDYFATYQRLEFIVGYKFLNKTQHKK